MQVTVTGGTGFVGSHTVNALLDAGHSVRLLVRSRDKAVRVFAKRPQATEDLVVGDVTDPAAVARALDGAEAVLHAAALVALEAARADEVYANNCRAVELVVGGAAERGISRIVYVSSAGALFRRSEEPLDEQAPVCVAQSAYARSKSDAEHTVRKLQDAGAPIATTYPTAIVGPDDPGLSESNHGISVLLNVTSLMTSGGMQLVDVRDLALAHRALLERMTGPDRVIVAGRFYPWAELADLIDEITGGSVRRLHVPAGLLRASGRVCDIIKRFWAFDFPMTHESMTFATQWPTFDAAHARDHWGIPARDSRETLTDLIRWLVAEGHVDAHRAPRLSP